MTTELAELEELRVLKGELTGLFEYIRRVKREIAAIHNPAEAEHGFESMGEQLDAIVSATEKATHRIMEAMEESQQAVDSLRSRHKKAADKADLDKIEHASNEVFEACSFQDITGQRVNKITKSLTYVEQRVLSIIDIWGKADIENVERAASEKSEDEKLLNGPQLEGKGLNQSEIDALFD
jgi:chemotaxis protein CheZ